jgi:predicted RNA-binding protein with TRAM domain
LFTTDFNLNQVASIEGVRVLNINELSHAMRPVALPGEDFELKIVQAGSNRDQGVGYLEDGTMVVVDNARRDIGSSIRVKVTKSHQTVAGKMLFGQKVSSTPVKQQKTVSIEPRVTKPSPTRRPQQVRPTNSQVKAVDSMSGRIRQPRKPRYKSQKEAAEASLLDAIDKHGE